MFEVNNLHYTYHDSPMYDFTLSCDAGEIVAILGESGSGKSTLLDLIAGFISPLSGTIMIDGVDITALSVEQRPLTVLFQHHNLFEHLSVEKNILLGISKSLKSTAEEKHKAKEILKEVGLAGYEQKLASTLSGGQQQRVALARALIRQKPLLLLDEPFTGLDKDTHREMLALVRSITDEKGLHTMMVTHEESDCDVADKVYRVKNRQLVLS